MRRGRRGKPHLLCPPCPPIGHNGGPGAGPGGSEAETNTQGAEQSSPRGAKAVRSRRGRFAGQPGSWSSQPRGNLYHGRSSAALRALPRTEELYHRSPRGARSQDRSREALPRCGSRHGAKPVSSVRLRGASTVQCDRICVPRVCVNQSYREPKQGGRHCVAHLLGGVRPLRTSGVLQRSTPVLVPFLLRGQVRLPVILHDAGPLERGPAAVPQGGATAVPQTSRGPRQRRQPSRRKSSGRSSWDHSGRAAGPGTGPGFRHSSSGGAGAPSCTGSRSQIKTEPATDTQMKPSLGQGIDPLANDKGQALEPKASSSSMDFQTESRPGPSCPSKPTGILSHATPGPSRSQSPGSPTSMAQGQPVTSPASGPQVSNKPRNQYRTRGSISTRPQQRAQTRSNSSGLIQPAGQTSGGTQMPLRTSATPQPAGRLSVTPQPPVQTSGPSQPAGRSTGAAQRLSVTNPATPMVQSPSATEDPTQSASKAPTEPGDSAPKSSGKGQKQVSTDLTKSPSMPKVVVPCHSESSLEYMSESSTEISCRWPDSTRQMHCPRHCWLFQHLAY